MKVQSGFSRKDLAVMKEIAALQEFEKNDTEESVKDVSLPERERKVRFQDEPTEICDSEITQNEENAAASQNSLALKTIAANLVNWEDCCLNWKKCCLNPKSENNSYITKIVKAVTK